MSDPHTPILQFGTSRFLQAHADLFFAQAQPARAVTVVQSSGDATRAKRLGALANPEGYPVRIRGLQDGHTIDEEVRCTSVKRTLSTATDWDKILSIAVTEAEVILSNTGDSGFAPRPADRDTVFSQDMSYPAKLFHLLAARFDANRKSLVIMPTELIPNNGDVLKKRIMDIGQGIGGSDALLSWIEALPFANSLVDRIVSEPIEPAGAIAEPYALWAIERADGVAAPCIHPSVHMVDSLEEVTRLKLHILNLGHTVLADLWSTEGGDKDANVRALLAGTMGDALRVIYQSEVLPGFKAMGMGCVAASYAATTLERFDNPFLDHRIADIGQNHSQKVDRRIGAFLDWIAAKGVATPKLDRLVGRAKA